MTTKKKDRTSTAPHHANTAPEADQEPPEDQGTAVTEDDRPEPKVPAKLPDLVKPPAQLSSGDYLPSPVVRDATQVVERKALVDELIRDNMQDGVDYGKIPGTNKDTLFKGGAEQLASWFGYAVTFPDDRKRVHEDWSGGFFAYSYVCEIIDRRTGSVVAECEGSANSKETKYRWRWAFASEVREAGLNPDDLESKTRKSKRTGKPYKVYKIENDEPFDLLNTLQKMAQKRAMVGAVLIATAQSGRFTQDVEDMPAHARGVTADDDKPAPPPPASFFDMAELWVMADDHDANADQWKYLREMLSKGLTAPQVKTLEGRIRKALKVEKDYKPDVRDLLGA